MFEFIRAAIAQDQGQAAGAVVAVGGASWLHLFGVDPGVAAAAALGSIGLLAFDTNIPARQAVPAVVLGFAVGTYGATPACEYLGRPESWKFITAVVLGLTGYFLLGGAITLAKKWRRDPINTAKEIKP